MSSSGPNSLSNETACKLAKTWQAMKKCRWFKLQEIAVGVETDESDEEEINCDDFLTMIIINSQFLIFNVVLDLRFFYHDADKWLL